MKVETRALVHSLHCVAEPGDWPSVQSQSTNGMLGKDNTLSLDNISGTRDCSYTVLDR